MIKKQFDRLSEKISSQKHKVLDRRRNRAKRDFLDDVYKQHRENQMTIVTMTLVKLRQLWVSCGPEAVWDVLSDGKSIKEQPKQVF